MNSTEFQLIFSFVAVIAGFTMLVTLILLRLTLGHRLKHALKAKGEYWDTGTLDFGLFNTALFAWACVIPNMKSWKNFNRIYYNLDVREFANRFEMIIAHLSILAVSITMVCTVFFIATEQLGIIQWQ